jgi:hypothetical protein
MEDEDKSSKSLVLITRVGSTPTTGIEKQLRIVRFWAAFLQNLSFSDNIISSIWGVMGYTVLLVFTLFKTGSLAKSVFAAH